MVHEFEVLWVQATQGDFGFDPLVTPASGLLPFTVYRLRRSD